jgi:hypothetical protein
MTNQSPSPAFAIVWHIDDSEWEEAAKVAAANPPGTYFDRRHQMFYWHLDGRLQMSYDGELMFRPRVLDMPKDSDSSEEIERKTQWIEQNQEWDQFGLGGLNIPDFAAALTQILVKKSFETAAVGTLEAWRNCDNPDSIWFRKEPDGILLWHSGGRTKSRPAGPPTPDFGDVNREILRVPYAEFFPGARSFLNQFVAEIGLRIPQLLKWDSFARFTEFFPVDFVHEVTLPNSPAQNEALVDRRVRTVEQAHRLRLKLSPAFRLDFDLRDGDWQKASEARIDDPRGTYYDTSLMVTWDLFRSPVTPLLLEKPIDPPTHITLRHEQLDAFCDKTGRPKHPWNHMNTQWSLMDLALQLCRRLHPERFRDPGEREHHRDYREPREFIGWDDLGTGVIVRPVLLDEIEAVVGTERFLEGAHYFIAELVSQIGANVPELLDWQTFDPIVEFIESTNVMGTTLG